MVWPFNRNAGITGGRDAAHAGAEAAREAAQDVIKGGVDAVREKGGDLKYAFLNGAAHEEGFLARQAAMSGKWYGYGEAAVGLGRSAKNAIAKPFKKSLGKGAKAGGLVALALAAVGGLAILSNRTRSGRRLRDTDMLPDVAPDMAAMPGVNDGLPRVMTAEELMAQQASMQQTMMGEPPVEGPRAMKVKMERNGLASGVNPAAPEVGDIDGKPVKDLGQSPAL